MKNTNTTAQAAQAAQAAVEFPPFKLVTAAFAVGEDFDSPAWASMTIDPKFLERLQHLEQIVRANKLESVAVMAGPDQWDQREEMRIRGDSLKVAFPFRDRCSFWYEAYPKHASYSIESRSVYIEDLETLVSLMSSSDRPLPDGFLLRDGIYFFDDSDLENLVDQYFESADVDSDADLNADTDAQPGAPTGTP